MNNIIVAGATGYLGSHIVSELQNRKIPFRAVARNKQKLVERKVDDCSIIKAEVTDVSSLSGQFEGSDVLISTVGITRQKDGLNYIDVDYQGNMNLLKEAKKAGVKKFIYISVINGSYMRQLKMVEAKERFVDELKASGMDYLVVRPNGFFSDMTDFLDMAKKGKVYLFGTGNNKLNPIHGADLAKVIVDSLEMHHPELNVGGPDILTQNEIAEMALKACNKPVKIIHLPDWTRKLTLWTVRVFTSAKIYGPIEFFLTMMGQDNIAPRYGIKRLKNHFINEADRIHDLS